jgi:hypothetical protein
MKLDSHNKEVKFLTKGLINFTVCWLLITSVISGVFALFDLREKLITLYYILYALVSFIYVLLLVVRIPFYIKEKKNEKL